MSDRLLKVGVLTGLEVDIEDRFDGMDRPVTEDLPCDRERPRRQIF